MSSTNDFEKFPKIKVVRRGGFIKEIFINGQRIKSASFAFENLPGRCPVLKLEIYAINLEFDDRPAFGVDKENTIEIYDTPEEYEAAMGVAKKIVDARAAGTRYHNL